MTAKGASAKPDPDESAEPDVIAVRMANAHFGAGQPGDVVTVGADLARSLIREGLAVRADTAKDWLDVTGR